MFLKKKVTFKQLISLTANIDQLSRCTMSHDQLPFSLFSTHTFVLPARRATAHRGVTILKDDTLGGQGIKVWGVDMFVTIGPHLRTDIVP